LAGIVVYFHKKARQNNPPVEKANSRPSAKHNVDKTLVVKPPLPKSAFCPIPKPPRFPDSLKTAFSPDPQVPLQSRLDELQARATEPADEPSLTALRWLVHQAAANETLRNEALKTLLAWDAPWMAADLVRMSQDEAQSVLWRDYCVQFMAHHYNKQHDEESYQGLLKTCASSTPAVREAGIFALASVAQAASWSQSDPIRFAAVEQQINQALSADQPTTVVTALRAIAVMGLKSKTTTVESLAADEKKPLIVRVAAVQALGAVGRKESLPILESCAQSPEERLSQAAQTALKTLKQGSRP
jgi:HEAT repeat protein